MPKDKRTKLETFGKKGTVVGYSENSKAFMVYVPSQRYIETYRDVIFDEDIDFWKSKGSHLDSNYETQVALRNVESKSKEVELMNQDPRDESDDHEFVESPRPTVPETRKRPAWLERTLKEVEGHVAPRRTFKERKKLKKYFGYASMMCQIIVNFS